MIAFLTCTLFVASQGAPATSVCSHHRLPVYATVRAETMYSFFDGERYILAIPVNKSENGTIKNYSVPEGPHSPHCRHRIQGEFLWFAYGPARVYQERLRAPRRGDPLYSGENALPSLLSKYKWAATPDGQSGQSEYWPAKGVAIDFLPLSDKVCRVFFFVMKTKKIESWETEWAYERKLDSTGKNTGRWGPVADERNPETIESTFAEDFYAFKRKADYYFVTQSGELYIAPPPKKGDKSRTMTALWDDKTRPIVGIIEDADNDKVWLFAQNKKDAKLGYYFEMLPRTSFETFDPTKLTPVNAGGRAKRLLEYLPLIRAEGKKGREKGS